MVTQINNLEATRARRQKMGGGNALLRSELLIAQEEDKREAKMMLV